MQGIPIIHSMQWRSISVYEDWRFRFGVGSGGRLVVVGQASSTASSGWLLFDCVDGRQVTCYHHLAPAGSA